MKRKSKIICSCLTGIAAMCAAVSLSACAEKHVHDWGEWQETAPATCTEEGTMTRVCKTDPSHTEEKKIDSVGHDWNNWVVETPASESSPGVRKRTCKNNEDHFETAEIPPLEHEHTFGAPEYSWNADDTECTATRTCTKNDKHKETETATAVRNVTISATCESDGAATASVTFENGNFAAQSKNITIAATGHAYGAPEYSWSVDNTECTATRTCSHDARHKLTYTSASVTTETTAPTCDKGGYDTITATFAESELTAQTKRINEVPAAGHAYGAPEYSWNADDTECTATRTCTKNDKHKETETATAVRNVTSPATCESDGAATASVTFENGNFAAQSKNITIAATGHAYGAPEYSWNADNTECTATRTCTYDDKHKETETATAVSNVTVPATCESDGVVTITTTFENAAFAKQIKTSEIPATGRHNYGDWSVTTEPKLGGEGMDGVQRRECSICHTAEESRVIMLAIGEDRYFGTASTDNYSVAFADGKFTLTLNGASLGAVTVYGANIEIVSAASTQNTAGAITAQSGRTLDFTGAGKLSVAGIEGSNADCSVTATELVLTGDGSADVWNITDGKITLNDGANVSIGFAAETNGKSAVNSSGVDINGGATLTVDGGVYNVYMNGDVNIAEGGAVVLRNAADNAIGSWSSHTIAVYGSMTVSGATNNAVWFAGVGEGDDAGKTHGKLVCAGTLEAEGLSAKVGEVELGGAVSLGAVDTGAQGKLTATGGTVGLGSVNSREVYVTGGNVTVNGDITATGQWNYGIFKLDNADSVVTVNGSVKVFGNETDDGRCHIRKGTLNINSGNSVALSAANIRVGDGADETCTATLDITAEADGISLAPIGEKNAKLSFERGRVTLTHGGSRGATGICLNEGGNSTVTIGGDMALAINNYDYTLGAWNGSITLNGNYESDGGTETGVTKLS